LSPPRKEQRYQSAHDLQISNLLPHLNILGISKADVSLFDGSHLTCQFEVLEAKSDLKREISDQHYRDFGLNVVQQALRLMGNRRPDSTWIELIACI
jgi:hypothetical protein